MCRQGSSDEVALLVAEFGLLDQQLANLAAAIEQSQAILITEDELIPVASEIPDMLTRLGIAYVTLLCNVSLDSPTLSMSQYKLGSTLSCICTTNWRALHLLSSAVQLGEHPTLLCSTNWRALLSAFLCFVRYWTAPHLLSSALIHHVGKQKWTPRSI